jgi:uncharacterized metal-binding protein
MVGLAYCFGLETIAEKVRDILTAKEIPCLGARCTMGGVRENQIDPAKSSQSVSCNPAAQAAYLNKYADFVIELGLCLGHDVIFHRHLTVAFTVLLVKDRVFGHCPLKGIESLHDTGIKKDSV